MNKSVASNLTTDHVTSGQWPPAIDGVGNATPSASKPSVGVPLLFSITDTVGLVMFWCICSFVVIAAIDPGHRHEIILRAILDRIVPTLLGLGVAFRWRRNQLGIAAHIAATLMPLIVLFICAVGLASRLTGEPLVSYFAVTMWPPDRIEVLAETTAIAVAASFLGRWLLGWRQSRRQNAHPAAGAGG